LALSVSIEERNRKVGQDSSWLVSITDQGRELFNSDWHSIRLPTRNAAEELSIFLKPALALGTNLREGPLLEWHDRGRGESTATIQGGHAHVEHLDGPFSAGVWFWSSEVFGDSHDLSFTPKSMRAAKWLCEIAARSV